MANARLGFLQLRIEIGRFERPKQPVDLRCYKQSSLDIVEDESHFLLECTIQYFLRGDLYSKVKNEAFPNLAMSDKLKYLLNSSYMVMVKHTKTWKNLKSFSGQLLRESHISANSVLNISTIR